jgi:hypothetical protein
MAMLIGVLQTTPSLEGHVDLVKVLPKDLYLGNLTNLKHLLRQA